MVTKDFSEACTEINEIFSLLDKSKVDRIPKKLRETFKKVQSQEYIPDIDSTKSLDCQNIKDKTKEILAYLYIKYWCKDEDQQEVNKILKNNYEKKELLLREKYNSNDIFKKLETTKNNDKNNSLTEYINRKSFFKRVINKIKEVIKIDSKN